MMDFFIEFESAINFISLMFFCFVFIMQKELKGFLGELLAIGALLAFAMLLISTIFNGISQGF